MDSHAIRCFQQVFEKKSIHQAAKDLCMTPQGVSRVIRALKCRQPFLSAAARRSERAFLLIP
ncbi:LysR family transcriptional regulator [uncultured Megasphaera sp.]|uniref:LysR family transcriptional regulator n=1 Tax=uncultured Megasphaera sp. TaxID=165188 RepID=UPI00341A2329